MPDAFTCPPGFILAGESCYFLQTIDLNWPDAETACEELGAHLVIVDDVQENTTILTLATSNVPALYFPWIGLTDHADEGSFRWVSDAVVGYANWGSGEPNNNGSWGAEEDCGELRTDGFWNDSDCAVGGDSICEYDLIPPGSNYW